MSELDKVYKMVRKKLEGVEDITVLVLYGSYARKLLNLEYPADDYSDLEFDVFYKFFDNEKAVTDQDLLIMFKREISKIFPDALAIFTPEHCNLAVVTKKLISIEFNVHSVLDFGRWIPSDKVNLAWNKGAVVVFDKEKWKVKPTVTVNEQMKRKYPFDKKKELESAVNNFLFHTIYIFKHVKRGEYLLARNVFFLNLLTALLKVARLKQGEENWWLGPVRYAEKTLPDELVNKVAKLAPVASKVELLDAAREAFSLFEVLVNADSTKRPGIDDKMKLVKSYLVHSIDGKAEESS